MGLSKEWYDKGTLHMHIIGMLKHCYKVLTKRSTTSFHGSALLLKWIWHRVLLAGLLLYEPFSFVFQGQVEAEREAMHHEADLGNEIHSEMKGVGNSAAQAGVGLTIESQGGSAYEGDEVLGLTEGKETAQEGQEQTPGANKASATEGTKK